eukprot:jgi/Chrzof1/5297/Cz15g21080.t1
MTMQRSSRFGTTLLLLGCALIITGPAQPNHHVGVDAQPITFSGAGCAQITPGPPANVQGKALSADSIQVSWDKPTNGACVDEYVVSVTEVTPTPLLTSAPERLKPDYNITIDNLKPDTQYRVTVRSYSRSTNSGNSASTVVKTLAMQCDANIRPGRPTNLRASVTGSGSVHLCWDGVDNNACIDNYRVSATTPTRLGAAQPQTVSKGGCIDINNLPHGESVTFTVIAANKNGDGPPATTQATP